jgi:hypothetical protein
LRKWGEARGEKGEKEVLTGVCCLFGALFMRSIIFSSFLMVLRVFVARISCISSSLLSILSSFLHFLFSSSALSPNQEIPTLLLFILKQKPNPKVPFL